MTVVVDATPVYDLGMVGELELLAALESDLVIPQAVVETVEVEPAATNLARFLAEEPVTTDPDIDGYRATAAGLLSDARPPSDEAVVATLLALRDAAGEEFAAGLVSDDTRLRAIADGLGATVTGSFGVVVRAALDDKYFSVSQAKRVVRRMDTKGLQSTGPLRAKAVGEMGDG
jgi:predicted nucleic acid-binding protein